jgi:hypothetical protein
MAALLRSRLTLVLLSALGMPAHAAETSPLDGRPVAAAADDPEPLKGWHGRVQLRRENVDRGTSEETTRTYLRSDNFVSGGMLSLQVAFPDENTDFSGSPFDPRLGDSKIRFRFAPFSAGRFDMSYFIEATFPTANPEDLGSGKYQLSAGVTASTALPVPQAMRLSHELRLTSQLQQANSVAGDEARPDINYTKLDLSLRDTWGANWAKVAVNMRADWEQNGKTGAVGELEYGRRLDLDWSLWFMAGGLLWGEGVKGTYGSKVMIGVDRWF